VFLLLEKSLFINPLFLRLEEDPIQFFMRLDYRLVSHIV